VRRLTKGTDHGPFRDGQAREALTRAKAGSYVDGDCRCAGRGRRRVGGWAAQLGSPARLGGVGIVEALLTWVAATAFNQLAAGPSAIMHQALSGIPIKVYARAAGEHTVGLWNLAGWTLLERGLRISMVGLGVWFLSKLLHPWLRRFYGVYLSIVTVLFTAALSAVIPRGPSRRPPGSNRCRGGHDADDDETRLVKCLDSQHDT